MVSITSVLEPIFSVIFSGVILGAIYALISMGLTLIWGTVGILNFAHGAVLTVGAYIALCIFTYTELGYVASVLLAALAGLTIGIVFELLLFRYFREKPNEFLNTVYTSLASAYIISAIILYLFGPRRKALPPLISGTISIGGLKLLTYHEFMILVVSLVVLSASWLFLKYSKYGIAMRAVSMDRYAARLMGIKLNRIYLLTVGVGCTLASISGVFLGSIYYVYPYMGDVPLVLAFIIIVFGGLGSVKGTIVASFILGIVQNLSGYFLGLGWAMPILFLFMMLTILLRPSGLLGEKV
jgi:branched-chain amino acid transport system permease protein